MKTSRLRLTLSLTLIVAIVVSTLSTLLSQAAPIMASPQGLSVLQIKMTGDEFIVLQNNSGVDIDDLSSYWLNVYNNVNPLASGVSNSSQQLPATSLASGHRLLLSGSPQQTCGASVAGKLALSLSDGGGFLQVTRTTQGSNGAVMHSAGDVVSWSSSTAGLIQNVPSNSKNPNALYYRYLSSGSYAWQLADLDLTNFCQLNIVVAGGSGSSSAVTPLTLAATSPPATILGETTAGSTDGITGQIPAADIGLNAPQLSELLPNPTGTGNDDTDEFIELYNPNGKTFDLTGFSIQSGTSRISTYVFPAGTMLAGGTFKAYFADETKIGLSNTAGQVNLVDPLGNVISSTAMYEKAKDGVAWASAKGSWYFSTQATPGAANIIKQPVTKKAGASKKKKTTSAKSKAVKGVRTGKATVASTNNGGFEEEESGAVVHTWVLALVAAVALLYGAYEYRRDITNRLYRLAAKLGVSRVAGEQTKGRRSD